MHLRSYRAPLAFVLTSLIVLSVPTFAGAAGEKDTEAMKLHDQAMDEDYLAVEFDKAEKKLKDALKKCGKDGCSEKVVGKLHVALGTVYGGGGKMDQAKVEFIEALKADPKAALIDALTTAELAKAFKDAQKEAGSSSGTAGAAGAEEPSETPQKPGGDISHTPVSEQAVNTPVPVYIEIPEEVGATKVTLRYKPFGSKKWKSLDMDPLGDGFGVEIPCEDVTTTGDIKYYIIAKDEAGDPAGTAGSLKDPYKVPIKNEIDDPPSLPGKKPPKQCTRPEDCPPGLPGCEAQRGDKGWGSSCEKTQECQSGLICLNGSCEEGTEEPTGGTDTGSKKNLVTVQGQFDLLLINGSNDVCSGRDESYVCFYPDGSSFGRGQFYGDPADVDGTNGVQGGFGVGGVRALAGYDRQIWKGLMAGLRVGYAFGGSPSSEKRPPRGQHAQANSFLPFHAEARVGWVFGDGWVEPKKFRPYAFVGGGLGQVNAAVPVSVCDQFDDDGETPIVGGGSGSCPNGTRIVRELDAYQITGLNFVAVGGGTTFGIASGFGVSAELKVMFMVPTFGIVFAPNIGPVFAF